MLDAVLILDSNAIDACAPAGDYHYLWGLDTLELVPVRVAREESERAPTVPTTPFGPARDAPVPMLLNTSPRGLNDAAVTLLGGRVAVLLQRLRQAYKHPANHAGDIENIACAVAYGERRLKSQEVKKAYFVTGDYSCCSKASDLVRALQSPVEVLFARAVNAKRRAAAADLRQAFPP